MPKSRSAKSELEKATERLPVFGAIVAFELSQPMLGARVRFKAMLNFW
jgi:hypothetical protein